MEQRIGADIISSVRHLAEAGLKPVIGNDIVYMPNFLLSCTSLFIRRSFTPGEIAYCQQFDDPTLRYASTWAAKEAVHKVVKQLNEHQKLWWPDIEIHRNKPQGKPSVTIHKMPDLPELSLTISHDGDYVWAIAAGSIPQKTYLPS